MTFLARYNAYLLPITILRDGKTENMLKNVLFRISKLKSFFNQKL